MKKSKKPIPSAAEMNAIMDELRGLVKILRETLEAERRSNGNARMVRARLASTCSSCRVGNVSGEALLAGFRFCVKCREIHGAIRLLEKKGAETQRIASRFERLGNSKMLNRCEYRLALIQAEIAHLKRNRFQIIPGGGSA